jgi:hypothetical protein
VAYNIQNAEARLTRWLHGTTLDQVTNPFDLFYESAEQVLLDIDPQETKVIAQIPIFNSVYDYPCPSDLKGNGAIDIYPQVNRQWQDYYSQQYNQDFDISKITALRDSFTVLFNSATKSLRINAPTLTAPTILNQASAIGNNGTWTADGVVATGLTANNTNYQSAGGALQFNLTSGTGYISNSTSGTTDISSMLNQGSLFCYVYLPTGSQFSGVTLSWGSSSSNYYSVTATTNQMGNAFVNGWNLLQFPWLGATVTGAPVPSKITYLKVSLTTTATQTGVLVNNIFCGMPLLCNIEYYSKYLFRDGTTGAFKEVPTATSDIINLDTETYNVFLYQCGLQMAQQQQGVDALFYDANYFSSRYDQAIERYKALYKSEKQFTQASYYSMPNTGYNQNINTNTFWGN